MAIQSKSQKIGTLGESIVELQVKQSDFWIARNLTEDFGIDLEIELATENVKGNFVKAQIKSQHKVLIKNGFTASSLKKSFLRYVYECRVPIILVLVSTSNSQTWYTWLQKWIIDSDNLSSIYDESKISTISVKIPESNKFDLALKKDIISIALWENTTQLYIALRDLANLSLRLYDDDLSQVLFDYLGKCKSANINDDNYLNKLIEQVIEIGTSIWATPQGNKISQMLFSFVRKYGEKLNADHISTLILRGTGCSRTGINALGILYDEYPAHVLSLNLIQRFDKFPDKRLHYYCSLREKYINFKSPDWLSETNDLTIGNIRADFSNISTSILDKWANRGDSVIFDYVYEMPNK